MEKITIGEREFCIQRPTFAVLDCLKKETGFDFVLGITKEQNLELFKDLRKLPRIISIITCDTEGENYDEDRAEAREDFFYKNADFNDFTQVMVFFSKTLSRKETDSSAAQKEQAKMKLVKTK